MAVLFDACVLDGRPTTPHPGHPLRRIQDLITQYYPELPRQEDLRFTLAPHPTASQLRVSYWSPIAHLNLRRGFPELTSAPWRIVGPHDCAN
jgi:hypothetical protein